MPDLIMTYGWRYSKDFKGLGAINVPKVHIVVDYARPHGLPKQDKFHRQNKYDILFVISQNAHRLITKNTPEIPAYIIPFSVDTNIYKPMKVVKQDMVLAAFNSRVDVYPNRNKIRRALNELGVKSVKKKIIHHSLITAINRCKISVTSNNLFASLSMRYTETLACGGFLLADRPEDLELVGLEDGKHLVIYNETKDFKKKVRFYMQNDTAREAICRQGMNFVRKNHSCEVRVKQVIDFIKLRTGIK